MNLIIQLLVSAVVFFILSKILPGFTIKDAKTAVIVALLYGVLMVLSTLLVSPLSFLTDMCAKLVSWIPIISSIANAGAVVVKFLLNFIIGAIMLCITDKFVKGFEMLLIMYTHLQRVLKQVLRSLNTEKITTKAIMESSNSVI